MKEHCAEQAKKRLIAEGTEDFNYLSYSEMPSFTDCNGFVNTLPLMGGRKLLLLRKCGFFGRSVKQKSDWEEMFSNLPDYICVLLWEAEDEKGKKASSSLKKVCEKAGVTVEFPLQTEAKLVPWLAKVAANGGKLIDRNCASYIIGSLGRSMCVLKTEMQKITAYAQGEQITRDDVDAVIIKPTEDRAFKLIDAVMEGRRDLCFGYLREMQRMRTEPVAFLSLLSGKVLGVYHAKLLLNEGLQSRAAEKAMGGGWMAEKSVRQAQRSSEAKLERLISLCQSADKSVKQGKTDAWAALELITAEMKIKSEQRSV